MPVFGNRSRFCIEIASAPVLQRTRTVDIWAAGHWLTCDDNAVDVPQFTESVRSSLRYLLEPVDPDREGRPFPELTVADNFSRLRSTTDLHRSYSFLDWGPTTDNTEAVLFRAAETAFVPFAFWRPEHHLPSELGQVFVAELPERELLSVLHHAAWALTGDVE